VARGRNAGSLKHIKSARLRLQVKCTDEIELSC